MRGLVMIKTEALTRKFWGRGGEEIVAVDSVSLEIEAGEIFGLLGPNGAGKTTFLRMLATVLTPSSGRAVVNGYQLDDNHFEIKRSIGFLSGNTKLYGRLTPRELLKYFGELYELDKRLIKSRSERIFEILNMKKFINKRIEKLSTGQTQKASIARCLLHDPDIYIFDEPTLGLDILTSKTIIEFIRQKADTGKTIIFSTHYMEEAESLCDRIALIHQGRILDVASLVEYKDKTGYDNLRDIFFSYLRREDDNYKV